MYEGTNIDPVIVPPGSFVHGRLYWHGEERAVAGVLDEGFLIAGGRVLVRLRHVTPTLPGEAPLDVWVEASTLRKAASDGGGAEAATYVLRSCLHELPGDQTRDYAVRALSGTVAAFVGNYGHAVTLAPGPGDGLELTFVMDVPADEQYLWKFHLASRPGTSKRALWTPPPPPLAGALLTGQNDDQRPGVITRAHGAHHAGHLSQWLTTRRFWSVFRWHDGRLQHVLQFSLARKWQRTLIRRFGLHLMTP